jgi:hypothetical protein
MTTPKQVKDRIASINVKIAKFGLKLTPIYRRWDYAIKLRAHDYRVELYALSIDEVSNAAHAIAVKKYHTVIMKLLQKNFKNANISTNTKMYWQHGYPITRGIRIPPYNDYSLIIPY